MYMCSIVYMRMIIVMYVCLCFNPFAPCTRITIVVSICCLLDVCLRQGGVPSGEAMAYMYDIAFSPCN